MSRHSVMSPRQPVTVEDAWQNQLLQVETNPQLHHEVQIQGPARFVQQYEHLRALPRWTRHSLQRKFARSLAGVAFVFARSPSQSVAGTPMITRAVWLLTAFLLMTFTTASAQVQCTADAKQCPDGSFVSRDPANNCEFFPCPVVCTADAKQCPDGSFVLRDPANNCEFFPCGETCLGEPATIVGTAGNDAIQGTNGNDVIVGLAGNDIIKGFGGADLICAGPGNDAIDGGRGDDTLLGGAGNDNIKGSFGEDTIEGGAGNDVVQGGPGADDIMGEAGNDLLKGQGEDDILDGGEDDDILDGGPGSDTCTTGELVKSCNP